MLIDISVIPLSIKNKYIIIDRVYCYVIIDFLFKKITVDIEQKVRE